MEEPSPNELWFTSRRSYVAGVVCIAILLVVYFVMPPRRFPVGQIFTVKEGAALGQVSYALKEEHLIRSRLVFEFCMISLGGEKHVVAGDYLFKEPINTCAVASRIARGVTGVPAVKATFPEGLSNREFAAIAAKVLPKFDEARFIDEARAREGYLFPETYFFDPNATAEDVVQTMNAQFERAIKEFASAIKKSGHTERDIVIMASIIEKEARTPEDQAVVSGILWKRIEKGMPLQVDAPFYYLLGKESRELTQTDLAMKSGYNTYKNKGLPIGPIGNPGLSALRAAIMPTASPYLYYLSDKTGTMHYAKNFEEHKENRIKYLR